LGFGGFICVFLSSVFFCFQEGWIVLEIHTVLAAYSTSDYLLICKPKWFFARLSRSMLMRGLLQGGEWKKWGKKPPVWHLRLSAEWFFSPFYCSIFIAT